MYPREMHFEKCLYMLHVNPSIHRIVHFLQPIIYLQSVFIVRIDYIRMIMTLTARGTFRVFFKFISKYT